MSMALECLWHMLSLTNPSPVALSVTAGVGGWAWTISTSAMRVAAPLLQLTKRAPSSAFIALARKFVMVVYTT